LEWECPKNEKEVPAFVGYAILYCRIIKHFSKLAKLLTDTTSEQFKAKNRQWSDLCETAFEALKQRITIAPVFRHYDPILPIIIEMDASNFVLGAVLSQNNDRV
jgi:hypothetical protein